MQEIKAIVRAERTEDIVRALHEIPDLPGVTVSVVRGIGRQHGGAGSGPKYGEIEMAKLETFVPDELVDQVIATIREIAHTGRPGDGRIFVSAVTRAISIRDDPEATHKSVP